MWGKRAEAHCGGRREHVHWLMSPAVAAPLSGLVALVPTHGVIFTSLKISVNFKAFDHRCPHQATGLTTAKSHNCHRHLWHMTQREIKAAHKTTFEVQEKWVCHWEYLQLIREVEKRYHAPSHNFLTTLHWHCSPLLVNGEDHSLNKLPSLQFRLLLVCKLNSERKLEFGQHITEHLLRHRLKSTGWKLQHFESKPDLEMWKRISYNSDGEESPRCQAPQTSEDNRGPPRCLHKQWLAVQHHTTTDGQSINCCSKLTDGQSINWHSKLTEGQSINWYSKFLDQILRLSPLCEHITMLLAAMSEDKSYLKV